MGKSSWKKEKKSRSVGIKVEYEDRLRFFASQKSFGGQVPETGFDIASRSLGEDWTSKRFQLSFSNVLQCRFQEMFLIKVLLDSGCKRFCKKKTAFAKASAVKCPRLDSTLPAVALAKAGPAHHSLTEMITGSAY